MSSSIEDEISYLEKAIKQHDCPAWIGEHVEKLIKYFRESLRSSGAPSDAKLMDELHRLAAGSGMQISKMTRTQLTSMLAEVIQKTEIRRKFFRKASKRRKK